MVLLYKVQVPLLLLGLVLGCTISPGTSTNSAPTQTHQANSLSCQQVEPAKNTQVNYEDQLNQLKPSSNSRKNKNKNKNRNRNKGSRIAQSDQPYYTKQDATPFRSIQTTAKPAFRQASQPMGQLTKVDFEPQSKGFLPSQQKPNSRKNRLKNKPSTTTIPPKTFQSSQLDNPKWNDKNYHQNDKNYQNDYHGFQNTQPFPSTGNSGSRGWTSNQKPSSGAHRNLEDTIYSMQNDFPDNSGRKWRHIEPETTTAQPTWPTIVWKQYDRKPAKATPAPPYRNLQPHVGREFHGHKSLFGTNKQSGHGEPVWGHVVYYPPGTPTETGSRRSLSIIKKQDPILPEVLVPSEEPDVEQSENALDVLKRTKFSDDRSDQKSVGKESLLPSPTEENCNDTKKQSKRTGGTTNDEKWLMEAMLKLSEKSETKKDQQDILKKLIFDATSHQRTMAGLKALEAKRGGTRQMSPDLSRFNEHRLPGAPESGYRRQKSNLVGTFGNFPPKKDVPNTGEPLGTDPLTSKITEENPPVRGFYGDSDENVMATRRWGQYEYDEFASRMQSDVPKTPIGQKLVICPDGDKRICDDETDEDEVIDDYDDDEFDDDCPFGDCSKNIGAAESEVAPEARDDLERQLDEVTRGNQPPRLT